jgi:SAM-dependent methyltransferase
MTALYDRIGVDYASLRKPDPRWEARLRAAANGCRTLVNVGGGAGSYETVCGSAVAVDPSRVMLAQRPASAAPAVCGVAEALPFRNRAFDVSLVVLTVHHWTDAAAGLAELCRVSRRQLVVTWDQRFFAESFWLVRDYLPEAVAREAGVAVLSTIVRHLPPLRVEPLPVPSDCTDGFFGAYWKRPEAYLDLTVRGAISALALLDEDVVRPAMERLRADLDAGRWGERYGDLAGRSELDLGYRLVVAGAERQGRGAGAGLPSPSTAKRSAASRG